MPTKDEHLAQAEDNEKLAEVLSKTVFVDWAVTVYFYAALHYVHAILAVYVQHPTSHETTGNLVHRNPVLKRIFPEYKSLQTASRNARYYATEITPNHLQTAKQNFEIIKSYVRKELGLE